MPQQGPYKRVARCETCHEWIYFGITEQWPTMTACQCWRPTKGGKGECFEQDEKATETEDGGQERGGRAAVQTVTAQAGAAGA